MATNSSFVRSLLSKATAAETRYRRWRWLKDKLARGVVVVGGYTVIGALLLIFAYLFYVVLPLFQSADAQTEAEYTLPAAPAGALVLQEHNELAASFAADGQVLFLDARSGELVQRHALPLPEGVSVTSFAESYASDRVVAYGLSDGRALLVRYEFKISYPEGRRVITPSLEYPLGEEPVVLDEGGRALATLAVQLNEAGAGIAGLTADGALSMASFSRKQSFLTGEVSWEREPLALPPVRSRVSHLLLKPDQSRLFVFDEGGELRVIDLRGEPDIIQRVKTVGTDEKVTAVEFLTGGNSLLIGTSRGRIMQWFAARNERNQTAFAEVRSWRAQNSPITAIAPENGRRGFLAGDASGRVGVYHSTAHRTLDVFQLAEGPIRELTVSPRNDTLLLQNEDGRIGFVRLDNPHPEISWNALWGKVWYEGYAEPQLIWQSSAANSEFEPKFSLTPLAFGTLKAAFYAMLFAVPLAVMGAVYTAYFMSPRMRGVVKPAVEIMEALPTVILGFLAGLWLAPVLEAHLPGFLALLIVLPPGVLLVSWLWSRLPEGLRTRVPAGWEAALLIPVLLGLGALAFGVSPVLEDAFFGGDARAWLINDLGLDYDQRNALVVGIAMGIAVIPNIFSIAEDAIFSVPRHLSQGALALGATPWQALTRVVLLTASPGIFSAIMIGLGRAVGETMIVLMATGNTAVMDFSIFEGMRTLSANVAVEMPETAVDSTHYRVLFLSGLVLFLLTFIFNTVAEVVRQRLRDKYSSL